MRLWEVLAVLGFASSAFGQSESVDIRAFGDSGYIGGLGVYAPPPENWVQARLKRVEVLRSADVNFLNLEGSLTRSCETFVEKPFPFAIAPEALAAFGAWGFNLVSLANNHTLDCLDPAPAAESALALEAAQKLEPGLQAHGIAASNKGLLARPAVLTVRGVKLGMVALKVWGSGRRASIGNFDNRVQVMRALAREDVDVRILSLHGGVEGLRRPTDDLIDLARAFISRYNGDIVFAHHPHRSQGFEVLAKANGRYGVIFYSLGNGLHNGLSVAGDGLAARVKVRASGVDPGSLAVFPLVRPSWKPRSPSETELTGIASELRDSSVAVAVRPLPAGLTRVPFTLETVRDPALGLRLALDPGRTGAVRPKQLPGMRALAKPVRLNNAHVRSKQHATRPVPRRFAVWLPPPAGQPHILKNSH